MSNRRSQRVRKKNGPQWSTFPFENLRRLKKIKRYRDSSLLKRLEIIKVRMTTIVRGVIKVPPFDRV